MTITMEQVERVEGKLVDLRSNYLDGKTDQALDDLAVAVRIVGQWPEIKGGNLFRSLTAMQANAESDRTDAAVRQYDQANEQLRAIKREIETSANTEDVKVTQMDEPKQAPAHVAESCRSLLAKVKRAQQLVNTAVDDMVYGPAKANVQQAQTVLDTAVTEVEGWLERVDPFDPIGTADRLERGEVLSAREQVRLAQWMKARA